MNAHKTDKPAIKTKGTEAVNAPKENAFSSALGIGIDALFANSEDPEFVVNLDDIEIVGQVREEMEDGEQTLSDLGDSLLKYQIQAIFLRIMPAGHPKPYRLVAGERRYRAAKLKDMTQLRAKAKELTDAEADDLQFAENVHRKNLTQIEEAKKIKRDLDELGSNEAVLAKHKKSKGWLSKVLSLLELPEQTKRLVTEQISADVEVIGKVKAVEKVNPAAAKELVNTLKATRGKGDARDKADAVKATVKPSKKAATGSGVVATPKDTAQQKPSQGMVSIFPDAKPGAAAKDKTKDVITASESLNRAYTLIFENGSNPKMILDVMKPEERASVEAWLRSFYDAGKITGDMSLAVIQGFRLGKFSTDGDGAFALMAFLQGADKTITGFDAVKILGLVKE
jgi:ParB family chromosome partitioning protein